MLCLRGTDAKIPAPPHLLPDWFGQVGKGELRIGRSLAFALPCVSLLIVYIG